MTTDSITTLPEAVIAPLTDVVTVGEVVDVATTLLTPVIRPTATAVASVLVDAATSLRIVTVAARVSWPSKPVVVVPPAVASGLMMPPPPPMAAATPRPSESARW